MPRNGRAPDQHTHPVPVLSYQLTEPFPGFAYNPRPMFPGQGRVWPAAIVRPNGLLELSADPRVAPESRHLNRQVYSSSLDNIFSGLWLAFSFPHFSSALSNSQPNAWPSLQSGVSRAGFPHKLVVKIFLK